MNHLRRGGYKTGSRGDSLLGRCFQYKGDLQVETEFETNGEKGRGW